MKAQPRSSAEPWLRGPIPGISPLLMPAAHCLEQVIEDLTHFVAPLTDEQIWAKPAGAPSVGFHLRHIHGSIDRLLTYADARSLSEQQIKALAAETDAPSQTLDSQILLKEVLTRIDQAIAAIRFTKESDLLEPEPLDAPTFPQMSWDSYFILLSTRKDIQGRSSQLPLLPAACIHQALFHQAWFNNSEPKQRSSNLHVWVLYVTRHICYTPPSTSQGFSKHS